MAKKSKDWMQKVTKDIEARGTKGVCTGDNTEDQHVNQVQKGII